MILFLEGIGGASYGSKKPVDHSCRCFFHRESKNGIVAVKNSTSELDQSPGHSSLLVGKEPTERIFEEGWQQTRNWVQSIYKC
jgi:hypothetical protein